MLDLNDAYAIAKFIKDAEKQTPVKVYISTTAEIAKAENFKVFGNNGEYTLIGDYKTIMDAIAPIKDQITDMYVENSARNSAIQMIDMLGIDARIEPGAIIRDLDLRRPIYKQVAAYGHFGRTDIDLPWERTDKAETLKEQAGI